MSRAGLEAGWKSYVRSAGVWERVTGGDPLWEEVDRLVQTSSSEVAMSLFLPREQLVFDDASLADQHATRMLKLLWVPVALLSCGSFFAAVSQLSPPIQALLSAVVTVAGALVSCVTLSRPCLFG